MAKYRMVARKKGETCGQVLEPIQNKKELHRLLSNYLKRGYIIDDLRRIEEAD